MDKNEQRAHDLSLLFVKQKIDLMHQNYDAEYDEAYVYKMYKTAYNYFYETITTG